MKRIIIKFLLLFKKSYLPILLIGLLLRIYGLSLNPVGITHDEIHDLINAKSIALTGNNAAGTIAGIFTKQGYCDSNCIFGELVSFLLVPWMKIFPLDLFWSKIPFIMASLGIIYFAGKFLENISGKKSIGLLTSAIIAINPWAVHFSRSAYENLFTFCFYLGGLYILTKKNNKVSYLFLGLAFLLLGFLSYMGGKPIFPFLVFWAFLYKLFINKFTDMKWLFLFLSLGIFITFSYLLLLKNSEAGHRLKEINIKENVIEETNRERQTSLQIPIFRDIVINKYSVYIGVIAKKYLGIFSPVYLFNEGEGGLDVFIIPNQSYMYLHEFPLLIFGIAAMSQDITLFILLLGLIAIIPLPSVLSGIGVTYALRAGLIFPIFCGIIAWGIIWFKSKLPSLASRIFISIVFLSYLLSFCYFFTMYWYRAPFEKNVGWFFHERVASRYINLALSKTDFNIILISKNPLDFLYVYSFYTGRANKTSFINDFNQNIKNKRLVIDKLHIVSDCSQIDQISKNTTYILQQGIKCDIFKDRSIKIADTRDSGEQFIIANDLLCANQILPRYPYPKIINEFQVEMMDTESFCKTWISNPDKKI